jgi:hypothetical protein
MGKEERQREETEEIAITVMTDITGMNEIIARKEL